MIGEKEYNALAVMGRLASRFGKYPLTYLSEIMDNYYKYMDILKNKNNVIEDTMIK